MDRPAYKRVPSHTPASSTRNGGYGTSLKLRLTTLVVFIFAVGAWLVFVRPQQAHGEADVSLENTGGPQLDQLGENANGKEKGAVVMKAIAYLYPDPASKHNITGKITFTQKSPKVTVDVSGEIYGIPKGNQKRGFHIHALGTTHPSCTAAGPHFNPFNVTHGAPTDAPSQRHIGDLGNVDGPNDDGVVKVDIEDALIMLRGERSIIGRSVVLHGGEDDLGRGDNEESLKTGNAGARVACGVIVIAEEGQL